MTIQRRQWEPTPVLLSGESHGWKCLVDCNPWSRKESNTTGRLHFDFSLSCIGEGNGNPLQCSCLENPRGGGAWWVAIYGLTQSLTRLKWLSSSSSQMTINLIKSFKFKNKLKSLVIIRLLSINKNLKFEYWLYLSVYEASVTNFSK